MSKGLAPGLVRFGTGAAMALLVFVAGCGGKRMAEVSGTVTFHGQPLPSGSVTFFDKNKQVVGTSTIVAGKYKIRDVPVGTVSISVTSAPPPHKVKKGSAPPEAPSPDEIVTIPPMYASPEKSGLTYQVKPGPQKHPIELN